MVIKSLNNYLSNKIITNLIMNIKDNLLEMKNLSELMVDLAYSSLFLQDKSLKNEVNELFEDILNLQKETLKLIFKVKINDEERVRLVNLLEFIKDYSNAAVNISNLTDHNENSVVHEVLSESEDRVITQEIKPESICIGKTIGECRIRTLTGLSIVCVKRGNKRLFNINKRFKFHKNDLIIGIGSSDSNLLFKKLQNGKIKVL